jgi:acyl carrier protein
MTGDRTPDIRAEVKDYILREFLPGADADEVDESTPLITGGILTSISTMKLVAFLESRFGIQFKAHEMGAKHLDNLGLIAATVQAKLPR